MNCVGDPSCALNLLMRIWKSCCCLCIPHVAWESSSKLKYNVDISMILLAIHVSMTPWEIHCNLGFSESPNKSGEGSWVEVGAEPIEQEQEDIEFLNGSR